MDNKTKEIFLTSQESRALGDTAFAALKQAHIAAGTGESAAHNYAALDLIYAGLRQLQPERREHACLTVLEMCEINELLGELKPNADVAESAPSA